MAKKKSAANKSASTKKSAAQSPDTKAPSSKNPSAKKKTAKKATSRREKKASVKAASERVTRNVAASALAGTNVEDWAKKLTGWQADALTIIRALVARHAPGSTLVMKWGQPVWEHNGPFAWLSPATKHVSFGFWRGAEMNDPDGHLEGDGDRMRHLRVTSTEDLKSLPIEGFVKQAIALNGSKGDPTKRN